MAVEIRRAYLSMIKAYQGGWDAMSAALGMSLSALENRIYERKGQGILVETALQMQAFSGTDFFAQAISASSGGTFVKLPRIDHVDNESLLVKFNELHAELGLLSQRFGEYTARGELNARERNDLSSIGAEIHRTMEELLALTFRIYCKHGGDPVH